MKIGKMDINDTLFHRRWLWHIAFWGLYMSSRIVMYYYTILYYDRLYLKYMLITEISFVALVYFTLYLYNYFIKKEKLLIYLPTGLLLWIGYLLVKISFQKYYLASMNDVKSTSFITVFIDLITGHLITFGLLTALKFVKDSYLFQYIEKQKKALQIESELSNLKAQISPHFLFNTMNNFYGLAVDKSSKLPELMVKLSGLLRYSLYSANLEKVLLDDEIRYISNYIALEKIRLEDDLRLKFEIINVAGSNCYIAPLLLIPFIENAFKHAKKIESESASIDVLIELKPNNIFTLTVKNNYLDLSHEVNNEKGIGLENVQKRLNALYSEGKHSLTINKSKSEFEVELILNL